MAAPFASVSTFPHLICITVNRPKPRDGEFSSLVTECEEVYKGYNQPFVLGLNLHCMDTMHPFDALQWMAMFFRVIEITKKHLICTCIHASPVLDDAINGFLNIYDPIKPFYCFQTSEAFHAKILQSLP